jgi:hypothetical protein
MGEIQPNVDWTAASTPSRDVVREHAVRGLGSTGPQPVQGPRRDVLETLLGKNNLAAVDASGGDPYNATGRHFRR